MLQFGADLLQQHDGWLVALAALNSGIACVMALNLLSRAVLGPPAGKVGWTMAAAFVFGCGAWGTEFTGTLAYRPRVPLAYDLEATLASIVVAVASVLPGFVVFAARPGDRRWAAAAGLLTGLGLAGTHFSDLSAVHVQGGSAHNMTWLVAALLIGTGLAVLGLRAAGNLELPRQRLAGAALLTAAICALHFIAVAAWTLGPLPGAPVRPGLVRPEPIAFAVLLVTLLMLLLSVGGSLVDEHLSTRLGAEARRLRQLANATFEGIIIHRDGVIVDSNTAFSEMVGWLPGELIGRDVRDFAGPDQLEERQRIAARSAEMWELELRIAAGSRLPVEILTRPIEHGGAPAVVMAVRDISDRKRAEDRIRHLAHHDPLTALPNRALFADRLEQALAFAARKNQSVAVLCLDLDGFKLVNDVHGHTVGDRLLVLVAERLRNAVRSNDTVARLGGDEFAIIQPLAAQPAAATALADRLIAAISTPFEVDGQHVLVGTSIGVAVYPDNCTSATSLLKNADTALYRAKHDGRSTHRFFAPAMDDQLRARRMLEHDLRQAVAKGQMHLYYQPLFDCDTQDLRGFEALLRWRHPVQGIVSPMDFVPLAEESGLIGPLGRWVLETACAEAATWPEPWRVAVNLSPAQFRQPDLTALVAGILRDTGLPASRLELEVTEGLLIEDTERALRILAELKQQGISIALDDFGTGYSSLSYLHRFPFDKLKIDRSFVQNLGQDEESMAIVRAIVGLARSLRLDVTAEGVETEEQLALLQAENCTQVQGFLLGRPLPQPWLACFVNDGHVSPALAAARHDPELPSKPGARAAGRAS